MGLWAAVSSWRAPGLTGRVAHPHGHVPGHRVRCGSEPALVVPRSHAGGATGNGVGPGELAGGSPRGTLGGAGGNTRTLVLAAPIRDSDRRGCSGTLAGTGGFSGETMCLRPGGGQRDQARVGHGR